VEAIQSAILSLSPEEYAQLRHWFAERDWEQWDKQIAEDAGSGKLDFLVAEAMAEKTKRSQQERILQANGPAGCLGMTCEDGEG
jgi:hypothetical protein